MCRKFCTNRKSDDAFGVAEGLSALGLRPETERAGGLRCQPFCLSDDQQPATSNQSPSPTRISDMDKTLMFVGAVMGGLGVAIGAFGAHGLRARLSPEMLAVFETGVRYHMYHALAILATAAAMSRLEGRAVIIAGWSFVAGIVVFSGSLYALALSGVTTLGAITPIGGVLFIAGWIALAIAAF
jgi:uncharacterized membrane protein YgdD (TMEM256/DUF423 family)